MLVGRREEVIWLLITSCLTVQGLIVLQEKVIAGGINLTRQIWLLILLLSSVLSRPIVGSDKSCDGAVKLVDSWEFLYVLFNKLDGQSSVACWALYFARTVIWSDKSKHIRMAQSKSILCKKLVGKSHSCFSRFESLEILHANSLLPTSLETKLPSLGSFFAHDVD